MYSAIEILGVVLTPVVTAFIILVKKLNLCKVCCCKSECSKSPEELQADEHIRVIALEEMVKANSIQNIHTSSV
jgi:hypothetical protein